MGHVGVRHPHRIGKRQEEIGNVKWSMVISH
jgi:hypothetical protein